MTNTLPNLEPRLFASEAKNAELKQSVTELETLPQKLVDDLAGYLDGPHANLISTQETNQ
ncbi:hypothetical protein IWQ49_000057 [Labrenzia sp. EL_126]|nr:hypothetical protein [Labrenzia sp. EL_126]